MNLIGIAMVKDEADIIEAICRHLLAEGIDRIIIADNLSTDGTWDILNELALETGQVTIRVDNEVAYFQARKMSTLARLAAYEGADWVLPFDADEMWYSPDGRKIADVLSDCPADVITARTWEHVPQPSDSLIEPDPLVRIEHRVRDAKRMHKVAFRAHPDAELHMGNHDVVRPGVQRQGVLAIREFQYRSLEQATRKLRNGRAAYQASTLPAGYGTHWREMGAWDDDRLAEWWEQHTGQPVIHDPAPVR